MISFFGSDIELLIFYSTFVFRNIFYVIFNIVIYVRHVQWSPSVAGACTIMYIPLKKTHLAGPERSRQGLTDVAKTEA